MKNIKKVEKRMKYNNIFIFKSYLYFLYLKKNMINNVLNISLLKFHLLKSIITNNTCILNNKKK